MKDKALDAESDHPPEVGFGEEFDKEIFDPEIDAMEENIEESLENSRAGSPPNKMKLVIGVDTN